MKRKFETSTTRFIYSSPLIIPAVCLLCYNISSRRERERRWKHGVEKRIAGKDVNWNFSPGFCGIKGSAEEKCRMKDIFRRFSFFFFKGICRRAFIIRLILESIPFSASWNHDSVIVSAHVRLASVTILIQPRCPLKKLSKEVAKLKCKVAKFWLRTRFSNYRIVRLFPAMVNLRKGEIIRIKILLKKGTNLARSSKIIRLDKRYNFYILFTRKTPIIILLFFFILFYFTTKCYGSTKVYAQVNILPL